jgi:hypothetical protein
MQIYNPTINATEHLGQYTELAYTDLVKFLSSQNFCLQSKHYKLSTLPKITNKRKTHNLEKIFFNY